MALNQIQLNAVLSAIAEYDAMGQVATLGIDNVFYCELWYTSLAFIGLLLVRAEGVISYSKRKLS